ncbi:hypothetical protein ACFE04_005381 [Oxalis oulophora]
MACNKFHLCRYGADIARGVAELHAAGVICANLRPSDFLLNSSGHALVSGYGLPMILKKPSCRKAGPDLETEASKVHWCIDCMSLSPYYTAPELWEPSKKSLHLFRDGTVGVSAESDSWSFGCALVEMCTGSVPWSGLSAEEIYRAVVKDGRLPPQYATIVGVGIPAELWKMIGECLRFKASKRPTFHEMLAVFLRHLQGIPQSATRHNNELTNPPGIDILEQSPTSVLDIFEIKSNHLHQLVSEGNLKGVRDLLAKSASGTNGNSVISLLEAHNSDGQTALHLACRRGCPKLVDAILKYNEVDVDIPDDEGNPPIVFALAAGSPECVRALLRRSNNSISRLKESGGQSLAHICAFYGQPECMHELLLAGADANAVDDEGDTVLHVAIAKKFTECALVILESGGSISMGALNSKKVTPLHLCIENLNVAVVKKWLEVASPSEIAKAIDVPSSAGTALCMAAALKKGREADGRELVRILLAAGATPAAEDTEHHHTALHTAAIANDVNLVKIILDAGVDVNLQNIHKTIPLHLALVKGAIPCVELLLYAGADCTLQDDDGDNAFHIAAEAANMMRESLECINIMLQYPSASAAVQMRNNSGKNLRDILEALPREWIPGDLMEALADKGIYLSPTIFHVGDWVTFKRNLLCPKYGWQGARPDSVGFVRSVPDSDHLRVTFCTGIARVLAMEVLKVIPLDRGQLVQLKPDIEEPRYELRGQFDNIGTVLCVEDEGIIRIGFTGASRGWQADPADFQRIEEFKMGDWIRVRSGMPTAKHGFGAVTPGSVGIVCGIRADCSLLIQFSYLSRPWLCEPEEIEPALPFKIGELVCVKRSVSEPRCAWGGETHHSVGRICDIESNGLLIIEIPNRPIAWKADPSDMERVEEFKVGNWVRVKSSIPSPKYGWEDVTRTSIGVIHSLEDNGDMGIAFCFRTELFSCSVTDVEKVSHFEVGQEVRLMPSVTQPKLGWSNETLATFGNIVRIDMDGTLNVRVAGRASLWKIAPGDAEKLPGFQVGDWVRSKQNLGSRSSHHEWSSIGKDSIAIVHSIQDPHYLELVCCFRKAKLHVYSTELEKVTPFKAGQYVKIRAGLVEPRWGWRGASPNSRGVVTSVNFDGEVKVRFFELQNSWRGDPSDLEIEKMFEVGEWVKIIDNSNDWKFFRPGSIGVVHGIGPPEDGSVLVRFCGIPEYWSGPTSMLEKVDKFKIGQSVGLKPDVKQAQFVIGSISAIDADGKLRVCTNGNPKASILDPSEVELVKEEKSQIGDWVRVKSSVITPVHHWGEVTHNSIGVVHRMEDDGELSVSFCFLNRLWICKDSEIEKVRAFKVGDKVRFRDGIVNPRWGWGMETPNSKGEVVGVDGNGKVRIKFNWREGRPWIGDPADIILDEEEEDDESRGSFSLESYFD